MKSIFNKINWLHLAFNVMSLALTLPAAAERMDQGTHDLVITKLEIALKSLPRGSSERSNVTLRLADLYADRARLQLVAEKGDQTVGVTYRRRAIALYKEVIPYLASQSKGETFLQLAHLQGLDGQKDAAMSSLVQASNEKLFSRMITSRARSKIGEIKFRDGKFADAEKDFRYALVQKDLPQAGFTTYRLAWAELNQGKVEQAKKTLIHLLETPELLTVQNQSGTVFDQSFHDDIAKDLVVFLARGEVGQKEVDLLVQHSPESLRRDNLYAFAIELERLGKKYSATMAWAAYDLEGESSPVDSIEKQIRVTQLQWDMGRKSEALEEYTKATELWRKKGCKGEKCADLAKRFKNFVSNWNKIEKDQPTRLCLEAYKAYLNAFSDDAEMFFKAATVASQLKSQQDAAFLYAQAAKITSENKDKKNKANNDLLEASLLKQIEATELSKDKALRLKSYESYLHLNPNGSKALEVRYQKANVTYEMGRNEDAFKQFFEIATEKATDQKDLRVKAADLSLDALASLKDDGQLFETAPALIARYPEREREYRKVQRQAAIQMAAKALNDKDSSLSQLKEHNLVLSKLDIGSASLEEQILILKNRIALSERTKDLSQVNIASEALLRLKKISAQDREFALGRLAWVAELRLDFKTALEVSKLMTLKDLSLEDRHLRLAMLTSLAGLNPSSEYKAALKVTRNQEKAIGIRAALVRLSSNPWTALKEHQSQLQKNPELFSVLISEAFAKTGNEEKVKKFFNSKSTQKMSLAQMFQTRELLAKWRETERQLARHELYTSSDAILQKSLAKRIELLNAQDRLGVQAVQKADWLSQLAILITVERENRRLYQDILRLPEPKQLSREQREQYKKLLVSKAESFKVKADQAERKAKEFWNNDKALDQFEYALKTSEGYVRQLLKHNLTLISKVAKGSDQRRIESILDEKIEKPSSRELAKAQAQLKSNPFDTDQISEVRKIAEKRGETTMVAFLDARLSQLKKGVRQ